MLNHDIKLRIQALEQELAMLKTQVGDPLSAMRKKRNEIFAQSCGIKPHRFSSIGSPLLSLIRETIADGKAANTINDADTWEAFNAMQEEILPIITKYYKLGRELQQKCADNYLEVFRQAAEEYYRTRSIAARIKAHDIAQQLYKAGYSHEDLVAIWTECNY